MIASIAPPSSGVEASTLILTKRGWRAVGDVALGTEVVHPRGLPSRLLASSNQGLQPLVAVTAADGTTVCVGRRQRLTISHCDGPDLQLAAEDLLPRDLRELRVPKHQPYVFGVSNALPLEPWALGALVGDGYLRYGSIQWCNEQPEMHWLLAETLPEGSLLRPLKVGQAGTGSASIVSRRGRYNPALLAIRELGLADCRAWEKFLPPAYMHADVTVRLALLQGCLDTDGSVDGRGRLEFTSSSQQLSDDVHELILSLGGRGRQSRRTNVMFTSPRQRTPKAARDAFRISNIRFPEGFAPFRRSDKAARLRRAPEGGPWKLRSVEETSSGLVQEVTVSAADGQWIGGGCFTLVGSVPSLRANVA